MRPAILVLAAALALAACGPVPPASKVPTLEPRSEDAIRVYQGTTPRCGFRDVGNVAGRDYRELRSRAFRLRANAVILDPQRASGGYGLSGMAVAFTRADCQQ